MRTLAVNVRWADNTETLKQHLLEGLGGVQSFARAFTNVQGAAAAAIDKSVKDLGTFQAALRVAEGDVKRLEKAWKEATTVETRGKLAAELGTATLGAQALADKLKEVKQELTATLRQPVNLGNLKAADASQRIFANQAAEEERASARRKKALESSAKAAEDAAKRQARAAEDAAKKEVAAAEDAAKKEMAALDSSFRHTLKVRDGQVKAAEDAAKKETKALEAEFQNAIKAREDASAQSVARMRALPEQLRAIGFAATTFLTAPIVGAATASIKFASDFEATTTKIRTLSNITAGDLAFMRKEMLDMAPAVGIGPAALAEAMLAVTSTGVKGVEAVDALRQAALMSAVGMGDAATAARALVAITHAYANEGMTAARASEIMFKIVKDGNADAAELAGTLGRVVGVASTLGIAFEDVGTFIASFTRLGVSTAEAVTAVRSIVSALELKKPSQDAVDALESVGLSFKQLRANIADQGFTKAMQDLFARFKGHETDLQPLIANVRGLAGAMGVFASQAGSVDAIYGHMIDRGHELRDAFGETEQTAAFKVQQLTAEIEKLGITIGAELLPQVKFILEEVIKAIKKTEEWVEVWKQAPAPVKLFTEALLVIVAAGGPVLLGMGVVARALTAINTLLFGAQAAAEFSLVRVLMRWGKFFAGSAEFALPTAGLMAGATQMTREISDEQLRAWQDLVRAPSPTAPALRTNAPASPTVGGGAFVGPDFMPLPLVQRPGGVEGEITGGNLILEMRKTLLEQVKALTAAERERIDQLYESGLRGSKLAEAAAVDSDVIEVYLRQLAKAKTATDDFGKTQKQNADAAKAIAAIYEQSLGTGVSSYAEAADAVNAYTAAIDAQGRATYETIIALHEGGATVEQLATAYHLTTAEVKGLIEASQAEARFAAIRNALELDGLKKSEEEWKEWAKEVGKAADETGKRIETGAAKIKEVLKDLQEDINKRTLSPLNFQLSKIAEEARAAKGGFTGTPEQRPEFEAGVDARAKGRVEDLYVDTDALRDHSIANLQEIENQAWTTYLASTDASRGFSEAAQQHFKDIAQAATKAREGIVHDWKQLGKDLAVGLTQSVVDVIGDKLSGTKINARQVVGQMAGQVGSAVGGLIGSGFGPVGAMIGSAIGSLAGPIAAAIVKIFDHVPSDLRKKAYEYGVKLSDEMLQGIRDDMDKFNLSEQAATIFNVSDLFPTIDSSNIKQATAMTRDLFSMIETGQLTVAQGTEALAAIFPRLAESATDAYGFISDELKEVIDLNRRFGTQSKEIAAFQKAQGQAAVSASNAIIAGITPQIDKWKETADKITAVQEAIKKAKEEHKDYKKESEELLDLQRMQAGEAEAHAGELQDLGTIALATFSAAVASGATFAEALAAASPGLTQLTSAFDSLGVNIEDAGLEALLLQNRLLTNAPQLLKAVSGLGSGFAALSNLGLLNVETFEAMQRTGMTMYTRLQGEVAKVGGTTKDALLPMQGYLHAAVEAAKKLKVPLDENTQMMLDQSIALGVWQEDGESATDKMIAAMTTLVKTVDKLIKTLLGIPDVDFDTTEHRRVVVEYDEDAGGGGSGGGGSGGGGGGGRRREFATGGFVTDTNQFPRLPSGDSEQIWATPGELVVTQSQQSAFVAAIGSLEDLARQGATPPTTTSMETTLAPVIVMVNRGASDAEIVDQTISALPLRIRRNNPSGLRGDILNALGMASTTWTGK